MYKFLNEAAETQRYVKVYIINGFQLCGQIVDIDKDGQTITVCDSSGKLNLIFISAISTIA